MVRSSGVSSRLADAQAFAARQAEEEIPIVLPVRFQKKPRKEKIPVVFPIVPVYQPKIMIDESAPKSGPDTPLGSPLRSKEAKKLDLGALEVALKALAKERIDVDQPD
jgi:hypothetical protein